MGTEQGVDRGLIAAGRSSVVLATIHRFMEAICLALTVRERHHGVFHQDKRWLVGRVPIRSDSAE